MMDSDLRDERARLHSRVRAYISDAMLGRRTAEDFDALGTALARYQCRPGSPYAKLAQAVGLDVFAAKTVRELPAVPADAFRFCRVAVHEPREDRAVFLTSGTSVGARGRHALSTTETYEAAALAWGRWGLFPDAPERLTAIALGPWASAMAEGSTPGDSSLGHMVGLFARTLATTTQVVVHEGPPAGVPALDLSQLAAACESAEGSGAPVVLLGTSFAFVHALDGLDGRKLNLPSRSRAMYTGGYKGRSRVVDPAELRSAIALAFGIPPNMVVGEYGMTELSSQLYEGSLRGHLGLEVATSAPGIFLPPPWLRVTSVDPATFAPLEDGSEGLLRFEDLANVDSAVAVQTADRGRIVGGGVELLGRAPGAPLRGCSLTMDDWVDLPVADR